MSSPQVHYALHGYGPLAPQFGWLQHAWYGTPHWAQIGAFSMAGHGYNVLDGQ
jgi:hypothetical protein